MTLEERFPVGQEFDPSRMTEREYIEDLYQIFLNDLVSRPLLWKSGGKEVSLRRQPEVEGRHAIFWHIITGGGGSEESRQIEHERCVRLRWVRILVELFNEEFPEEREIRWWIDQRRASNPRYVITRPQFDYIVVIEPRAEYALLVTAYFAERQHRRRKLRRDHDGFWERQEPPKEWTAPDTPSTPG